MTKDELNELHEWLIDASGSTDSPFESRMLMRAATIVGEKFTGERVPAEPGDDWNREALKCANQDVSRLERELRAANEELQWRRAAEAPLQEQVERAGFCVAYKGCPSAWRAKEEDWPALNRPAEPKGDRYIGEAVPLGPQGPPQASVITAYDPTTQTAHVRKISAFHCDFGCDVPSHKPGCPFYVNREAERGT